MRVKLMRLVLSVMLVLTCAAAALPVAAQTQQQSTTPAEVDTGLKGKAVARGTVPSEAARAAILKRLREVFGADAVVDRLEVGDVYAPPQWYDYVTELLNPSLKQISDGQLRIDGNTVRLSGSVKNEAQRQQILSAAAESLNSTYTINNALEINGKSTQDLLDEVLNGRTITFETASTVLTSEGRRLLDKIAAVLLKVGPTRLLVAGHTDNVGPRDANVRLSIERASAVKAYLVSQGVDASMLSVMGYGPDRPVASNATMAGRAQNRRIEFIVQQ